MRIKTIAIIALFMAVNLLCLPLDARAKFAVTDVEYLKGDDFVQLHFITDAIIPIPDLFYPEEDNARLIVMRIPDVDFVVPKDMFKFDSPVIDTVKVEKKEKFVDVNIKLKEKANYRVFTNQEGLFIEFPNLKRLASAVPTPTAAAPPSPSPSPSSVPASTPKATPASTTPKATPTSPPPSTAAATSKSTPKPAPAPAVVKTYGVSEIKDFKLAGKDDNRVRFEFMLSGPVDYEVIPVMQEPVRLAVDLKNTRAKQFKQEINCLNVKAFRGAFNTPTVFRVVFDLAYLKNYNVSFNNENNVLVVEFFNVIDKTDDEANKSRKTSPKEMKVETQPPADIMARDPNPNPNREGEPAITTSPQVKNKPGETIPARQENDFFAEEKSQVTKSTLNTLSTSKPERESSNDPEMEDLGSSDSQKSFLLQEVGGSDRKYLGDPMDFDFKNADLENVILFFSKLSGLSIVIDPGVTGTITARMYQVPWDQALQYFLKVNGLDMVREGNLLRIGKVAVLANEAQARRKLRESREMEGELRTFTRTLSYAQVGQLTPILKKQLSLRGDIIQDLRSNTLIISEVSDKIDLVDRLINTLDAPNPQVSIEARIVETNSNYTKSLGIQWGFGFAADSAYGNQTSLKFPNSIVGQGLLGGYAVNLPASGANSGVSFSLANASDSFRLDVALSAMEAQGKGRIISAPRTTTQNNMEAKIMQGKAIPVQTRENNTVSVRYVPMQLELKVKPQITAKGTIIIEVDIKNNAPDFGNDVGGLPPMTTQSIKTTVMLDDGGTIVIGGLYRVEDADSGESTPFFSKIPLLGNLFKKSSRRSEQKELLIFITPRIVK